MIRKGLEIRDILELLELEHLHRESCAQDYTKIATHLVVHHYSKNSKSDSSLLNAHQSCNFCKSFIFFFYLPALLSSTLSSLALSFYHFI